MATMMVILQIKMWVFQQTLAFVDPMPHMISVQLNWRLYVRCKIYQVNDWNQPMADQ